MNIHTIQRAKSHDDDRPEDCRDLSSFLRLQSKAPWKINCIIIVARQPFRYMTYCMLFCLVCNYPNMDLVTCPFAGLGCTCGRDRREWLLGRVRGLGHGLWVSFGIKMSQISRLSSQSLFVTSLNRWDVWWFTYQVACRSVSMPITTGLHGR